MTAVLEFLYREKRAKASYISIHHHNCWEIVYYFNGRGVTDIAGNRYHYDGGTFALIRAGTPHDERRIEETEVLFVGFTFDEDHYTLPEGIFHDETGGIVDALTHMQDEHTRKQRFYVEKLNLLTEALVIELSRSVGQMPHAVSGGRKKLHYARRFLDEHFSHKIAFADLASQYGYSYDRFRHLFKEETGFSPMSYLLQRRLQFARSLLTKTELSVASIASRSGFSSDVQFCALFKREFAMTPTQFRKSRHLPSE